MVDLGKLSYDQHEASILPLDYSLFAFVFQFKIIQPGFGRCDQLSIFENAGTSPHGEVISAFR